MLIPFFATVPIHETQKTQHLSLSQLRQQQTRDILKIAQKFSRQLQACGIGVKRMTGKAFFDWLFDWFNPDVKEGLKPASFPESPSQQPFGWDLAENLFAVLPESIAEGWQFNHKPHKVMTVQHLTAQPVIGHLTAERKSRLNDKVFNFMDHLPDGSVLSQTIVVQAQSDVERHLKIVHDSAVGRHALALKVKAEVETACQHMADGDSLLPMAMAVYLKGNDLPDLEMKASAAEVLFNSNGFKLISEHELFPADAYLRYLPMCYDYRFDQKNTHRARYVLLSDIARLLPFYGRSRGTENPGFIAFNRGGEPWLYDIAKDKTKNAHALVLGETGTGKSNLLNFLLAGLIAQSRPRLFIIEAGGSFDLFSQYCQKLGLSVNHVKINPAKPISLNPFAQGVRVIEQIEALNKLDNTGKTNSTAKERWLDNKEQTAEEEDNEDDGRDILGEMVIAALLMITGGESKEEARISRADRLLVMEAIIEAARAHGVKKKKGVQMTAGSIAAAFERLARTMDPQRDGHKIRPAQAMADSLNYFTKDPLSSQFFNTPGKPWALSDVTIVDMGKFAQEGYETQRSVAFIGCVGKVLELAERNQASQRAIYFVADENHLFTKIPLLAAMETRIAKMGRKLGLWLWLATQNLKDFADESRKMLSLMETWICLALPPDEIDQIERFKTLTAEQRVLFLSARKEKGKYTEGVLLSPKTQGLFRNIPPRLYLAMAATEQEEKHARKALQSALHCTELEAVEHIAKEMMQSTQK